MKITVAAPAKVNLWLRVGPRQDSGFHGISTLFCALDLADSVVIRGAPTGDEPGIQATFAPPLEALPDLGPPEQNLAVRAARAFAERAGLAEMPAIKLIKRIPSGGGLGGGSSDAGAVLRALRRLHPRALPPEEVLEMATGIGSDVPFFVQGAPLAHGCGRGERLTPGDPLPPRPVVLMLPPFPVSTGSAYRWLDESREGPGEVPGLDDDADISGSPLTWDAVSADAINDFEGPVFDRHPELRAVRDALRSHGARLALLAGSGSAVFGVFGDPATAGDAARSLRGSYPRYRVVLTGTRTR